MSVPVDREVEKGQAIYSRLGLALYDFVVLTVSNRWLWKCPTQGLLDFYNANVTANHLDIGVGTGFYLDRCAFPAPPRIALVDLNPNSLEATSRRIARYRPRCFERNALDPLDLGVAGFDSIGMNYLLHCLPGDFATKAVVLDHAAAHLNPGGVIFGATLLQGGVQRNAAARRLMAFYNGKGVFHNTADTADALRGELARRFDQWNVEVRGCAALFLARGPRDSSGMGSGGGSKSVSVPLGLAG